MIKFCVLGSGSRGNSTFVEVDGRAILLDAGFSFKVLKARLASINKNAGMIQDIFQSHGHKDHCQAIPGFKNSCKIHSEFTHGKPEVFLTPFLLSHDSECHGFAVQDKAGNKLAYVSDTGHVPENVYPYLFDCNAIILEFNHDLKLLAESPYPVELQKRIASREGHMNNVCSREFLETVAWEGLKYVVCFHLSGKCNNPALAKYEAEAGLKEGGVENCKVILAEQNEVGEMLALI